MRYRALIFGTKWNVRRMLPKLAQLGLLRYVPFSGVSVC